MAQSHFENPALDEQERRIKESQAAFDRMDKIRQLAAEDDRRALEEQEAERRAVAEALPEEPPAASAPPAEQGDAWSRLQDAAEGGEDRAAEETAAPADPATPSPPSEATP